MIDPKVRSPNLQIFDDMFEGADAAMAKAKETGKFDYDAPMEGLLALDRYTIRLKLKRPSYDLLSNLTTIVQSGAVAREVIEAYGDGAAGPAEPGGHGALPAQEWRRGQKIVLEANPGFREVTFPDSRDPQDREIVAKKKGAKLPRIGRVEITIIEESQPRLLAFEKGDLDYVTFRATWSANVMGKDNKPLPRFAAGGVTLARGVQPRSPSPISTWRIRSSAATPRTRSRCAARSAWPTTSTKKCACCARARACRRRRSYLRTSPATIRTSPGIRNSTPRAQRRCSTNSATSTATRTAGATCPTASR